MLTTELYGQKFPQSLFEQVSTHKDISAIKYDKENNKYGLSNCSFIVVQLSRQKSKTFIMN